MRYLSDRIAVLYLGRLMELGTAEVVFSGPHHPYTEALLSAVPTIDGEQRERIRLEGDIPSAADPPTGCVFHTRCPRFLGDDLRERGAAAGRGRAGAPHALPHPHRGTAPAAGLAPRPAGGRRLIVVLQKRPHHGRSPCSARALPASPPATPAQAGRIGDTRAQAERAWAQIQSDGQRLERVVERSNGARLRLAQTEDRIHQNQMVLAATRVNLAHAEQALAPR